MSRQEVRYSAVGDFIQNINDYPLISGQAHILDDLGSDGSEGDRDFLAKSSDEEEDEYDENPDAVLSRKGTRRRTRHPNTPTKGKKKVVNTKTSHGPSCSPPSSKRETDISRDRETGGASERKEGEESPPTERRPRAKNPKTTRPSAEVPETSEPRHRSNDEAGTAPVQDADKAATSCNADGSDRSEPSVRLPTHGDASDHPEPSVRPPTHGDASDYPEPSVRPPTHGDASDHPEPVEHGSPVTSTPGDLQPVSSTN
jgi:hypothetical protein